MPLYFFQNPSNEDEIVELFFKMNDEKKFEKDGIQWNRLYTIPTSSVDTQFNAYSKSDYYKLTESKKQTVGDLIARSEEFSQKRAEKNNGKDPIKEKYFLDYEKQTGKVHTEKKRQDAISHCEKLGFKINI